jgi:hypothetical protein
MGGMGVIPFLLCKKVSGRMHPRIPYVDDLLKAYHEVLLDINSKMNAVFEQMMKDIWGRLLS